jgi:hypothetical protein
LTVKAVINRRKTSMLTDTALRNLKPKAKSYKASDRDGMYVTVSPPVPSPFATITVSTDAGKR